jgi:phosphatidylserine synthase
MFIVVIGAALLMVSKVRYESIPKISKKAIMASPVRYALYATALILTITTKGSAIFPFFVLFILYGVARSTIERVTRALNERRAAALFADDESEDEEEEEEDI